MYPGQEPQQTTPNPLPNNMDEFNPNFVKPQNTTFIPNPTPTSSSMLSRIPKKILIIGVIIGLAILAMIIIVVVSMGKKDTTTEKPQTTTEQSLVPEPATSSGLQQTNTSIGQDLNSLDNAKDFSTTKLDDKTLGL